MRTYLESCAAAVTAGWGGAAAVSGAVARMAG